MKTTISKKKDKKPVYFLIGTLIFFSFFIFFITRPSKLSKAIKEVQACSNIKDVKNVFYKYKVELTELNDYNQIVINGEFSESIRTKLDNLGLKENEIKECLKWLPPTSTNLNVIVIPDLSRRIIDTVNNPNQIENDLFILNTIWQSFVGQTRLKKDSKDNLSLDVTDIDQAKGQFEAIANRLQFDLKTHTGKSNRLYFTDDKNKQFEDAINTMYHFAKENPLGADYRLYLRRYLGNRLKKSTIFDNYINKVIIITDGYLEAEKKPADTKINGYQKILYPAVLMGNVLDIINTNQLNIPKVDIDLSNTDILICEINERKTGKGYDFEILKAYWEDWMKRMNAREVVFIQREQANEITKKKIEEFLKN